jgi:hypothetical protein
MKKYYVNNKELEEHEYFSRLKADLTIEISKSIYNYFGHEIVSLYNRLSPLEQASAINILTSVKMKEFIDKNKFTIINDFKKEEIN